MQHMMKKSLLVFMVSLVLGANFASSASAANADEAKAFAKSSKCLTCHAVDKEKNAPAFTAIAAKYKSDKGAEAKLVAHLASGKTVKTSDGTEDAHPIVQEPAASVKNLVEWILSL